MNNKSNKNKLQLEKLDLNELKNISGGPRKPPAPPDPTPQG